MLSSLFLFSTTAFAASAEDLCAQWKQIDTGVKCKPGQDCLGEQTTFVTEEKFNFAANDEYRKRFYLGTGNCPLPIASVTLAIDTYGRYTLGEENPDVPGWVKIVYEPTYFKVTAAKDNKVVYHSPDSGTVAGGCTKPVSYLNAACPCNGTWAVNGAYNTTLEAFVGERRINKTECPVNTCNDTFWFNTATEYGNAKLTNFTRTTPGVNGTWLNETLLNLQLTPTSTDMVEGFMQNETKYEFEQEGGCTATTDPTEDMTTTTTTPPPPLVLPPWIPDLTCVKSCVDNCLRAQPDLNESSVNDTSVETACTCFGSCNTTACDPTSKEEANKFFAAGCKQAVPQKDANSAVVASASYVLALMAAAWL